MPQAGFEPAIPTSERPQTQATARLPESTGLFFSRNTYDLKRSKCSACITKATKQQHSWSAHAREAKYTTHCKYRQMYSSKQFRLN